MERMAETMLMPWKTLPPGGVHPDMDHIEIAPVERRELLGEIVAVHPRADCAVKPHYGFPRRLVYGIYVRFSIVFSKSAA